MIRYYFKNTLIYLWFGVVAVFGILLGIVSFRGRKNNYYVMQLFSWLAKKIAGIRVTVEGHEKILRAQPCVYLVNHQSSLDVTTMGGIFVPNVYLIAKRELLWIPLFNFFFISAGNILINRSDRNQSVSSLKVASDRIREKKICIGVMPEGTRNPNSHSLLPFKKGAFHLAIQAQVPLLPIVCSPLEPVYDRKKKKFPGGQVYVKVLDPIPTQGKTEADVDGIRDIAYTRMSEAYRELGKRVGV